MGNLAGGWSKFTTDLAPNEMEIFQEATKGIVGVALSPLAVATQVVAGVNYDFLCNGHVVRPDPLNRVYLVKIYKPLEGAPELDEIKQIQH